MLHSSQLPSKLVSMKLTALVNQEVKVPFTVVDQVDGSPSSGLTDTDFTKIVVQDDTDRTSAITLTITEIGTTGRYYASFTPDARGLWLLSAQDPSGGIYECSVDVGMYNSVETLRKETSNRHEIDLTAQEEIAYDDDNVSIIQRWPLDTDGGESVTTNLGVQTKRGAPILPRD